MNRKVLQVGGRNSSSCHSQGAQINAIDRVVYSLPTRADPRVLGIGHDTKMLELPCGIDSSLLSVLLLFHVSAH